MAKGASPERYRSLTLKFKETDNTSDRAKPPTPQKSDPSTGKSTAEKTRKDSKKGGSPHTSQKRKNFSRSQSVTTPKLVAPKIEPNSSYSRQSSFSTTMSDADLEVWKLSALDLTASHSSGTTQQKEPILTVAGSLTDSSNVTVGFDVKEEEETK